jgi:hypothetical protein
MQGCTAKVDSIRSILGSKNEFDGVTGCSSVKSSNESKVGSFDSENGATLDGYDVCVNKLTTVVAYASSWSSRLKFTQVCTEAMEALVEDKPKVRVFAFSKHGQSRDVLKGFSDTSRSRGSRGVVSAGKGGLDEHSVEDQERRSYLYRSECAERT